MNQNILHMSWQSQFLTSGLSSPFLENLPVSHRKGLALCVLLSAGESEQDSYRFCILVLRVTESQMVSLAEASCMMPVSVYILQVNDIIENRSGRP